MVAWEHAWGFAQESVNAELLGVLSVIEQPDLVEPEAVHGPQKHAQILLVPQVLENRDKLPRAIGEDCLHMVWEDHLWRRRSCYT